MRLGFSKKGWPLWKLGEIDKTGKVVINPQFDWAFDFSEGLAAVEIDGKYGFIDKTGKIVINPQFDWAFNFSEGLAAVEIDGKYGYINKAGTVVIYPSLMLLKTSHMGLLLWRLKGNGDVSTVRERLYIRNHKTNNHNQNPSQSHNTM